MDTNKKLMLMFRIKDHEIINLQNTLDFLSEKQQRLTIDLASQQNYQKFIDETPSIIQERDNLLQELEDIANLKYEKSNYTDMCANMCLYLINRQRQSENLLAQLQDQYIDAKYGKRFLFAELAKNDPLPKSLEKMKPKYKIIKQEGLQIAKLIEDTQNVLQSTKRELEDERKDNRESERSVPEKARNLYYSVNEFEKQLCEISRKTQKKQVEFNDIKSKNEKRVILINSIIKDLKDEIAEQTESPSKEIIKELKLIFENIISENRSSKFIKSRIDILLKSIPKSQQESKLSFQKDPPHSNTQNQSIQNNQQLTPQFFKNYRPTLIPRLESNKQKHFYTPVQTKTKTSVSSTSQSIKDLEEKFRLLKQQTSKLPGYISPPFTKSSE